MADLSSDTEADAMRKQNGAVRLSLPAVLCAPDSLVDVNTQRNSTKTLMSSESKLSLPSSLGTPTSPLRLSSPLSLPTSPTPFLKSRPSVEQPASPKPTQLLAPSTVISAAPELKDQLSSPTNAGSATGNPRNKCALQPGHSLMDWIRLGNSGKDLNGIGGRIRAVSPKELSTHNTTDDAWLAIRGRVYNITHYLPYHPGGPEELMRGAGIDATQLFDKVHPWVNYDSLLSKCLVGPLRAEMPDAEELFGSSNQSPKSDRLREPSKAQELVRKSMENLANCITPVRKKISAKSEENVKCGPNSSKIMQSLIQSSDLPLSISRRAGSGVGPSKDDCNSKDFPAPLRFDWIQTSTKLSISVYTGPVSNPGVCARLLEDVLLLEVATDGYLRTLRLVPERPLRQKIQMRIFAESGKIEASIPKAEACIWRGCGSATATEATRVHSPRSLPCSVRARERVSHDTHLLALSPRLAAVVVPLGHHVRVHYTVDGMEHVRSYTPVGDGWGESVDAPVGTLMKLAVKGYPTGSVSPHLTALNESDSVMLSGPYGNFQLNRLKCVKVLNLIAAGTGVTPMLGLLKFMLARPNSKCEQVNLLFFNKKEEDILFRNRFDGITKEDKRLSVTHVLSEASPSWSGRTGRINCSHLTDLLGKSLQCTESCHNFACVCGPTEFTQLTIELLLKLGMKEDCIHPFMG